MSTVAIAVASRTPAPRTNVRLMKAVIDAPLKPDGARLRAIVLTEEVRRLLAGHPLQIPAALPRPRVGAGIVDRRFVVQRAEVRTGEALDQVQLLGVRQAAI